MVSQSALLAAPGQKLRLPVAVIVTNQSPPVGDAPSLMTMECVPSKLQILNDCIDTVAFGICVNLRIRPRQQFPLPEKVDASH